jgi:uncharacterized protein (DUF2249 family)/iron-sulfur cluster repair protein YtfE (RIC family)
MSNVTEAMHNHHQQLVNTLVDQVSAIEEGRPSADPEGLVQFLKTELLPHAQGEERALYPAVDPIVKEHGSATATMSVDHEYIGGYIQQLDELTQALRKASEAERPALRRRVLQVATKLEGLFQVHLDKEERIYLPLFERYVSEGEQQRVLDAMHEATGEEGAEPAGSGTSGAPELDVRSLPPAQRHQKIFALFDQLPKGAGFILVNDHDPKPLYYQLNFEYKGQLAWDYLEEGPVVWRVRIGKSA